jgi:hypothetical protein
MAGRFDDIDDLENYCRALDVRPPKIGIVRQAVKEHIERNLLSSRRLRERFMAIKCGHQKATAHGLRVVK